MAQVVPDICPREKEFASIMKQMREDLVRIVHGDLNKYTFILFCGSGMITMDFKGGNWMVNKKKIRKKTGKADKDCRGVCLSWRSEHQWRCGFRAKRRAWHHAFQKYPEWILFKEYFQKGQEWKAHTGTGKFMGTTAPTVRLLYSLALEGYGTNRIGKVFYERNIPKPSYYKQEFSHSMIRVAMITGMTGNRRS